jgi:predicted transcriptional regulator
MQHGKLSQLAKAFHALSHVTKVEVLDHVIRQGAKEEPVIPTIVAHEVGISVAQAGYSLKRMSEAGILARQVTGRFTFYSIDPKFVSLVKEFLE